MYNTLKYIISLLNRTHQFWQLRVVEKYAVDYISKLSRAFSVCADYYIILTQIAIKILRGLYARARAFELFISIRMSFCIYEKNVRSIYQTIYIYYIYTLSLTTSSCGGARTAIIMHTNNIVSSVHNLCKCVYRKICAPPPHSYNVYRSYFSPFGNAFSYVNIVRFFHAKSVQ